MSSPERKLRFLQIAQIAFVVVCFFVKRIGTVQPQAISLVHWLVIVAAIWSAISGFTMQRSINRKKRSTSLARWRAGHMIRLSTATAVCLWGMVLHYFGGPEWVVNILLGVAILLLFIWRPGAVPAEA